MIKLILKRNQSSTVKIPDKNSVNEKKKSSQGQAHVSLFRSLGSGNVKHWFKKKKKKLGELAWLLDLKSVSVLCFKVINRDLNALAETFSFYTIGRYSTLDRKVYYYQTLKKEGNKSQTSWITPAIVPSCSQEQLRVCSSTRKQNITHLKLIGGVSGNW